MMTRPDSNALAARTARLVALALLSSAVAGPLFAQTDGAPLASGIYRKLHSTVLSEDRTLIVGLPADYEKSARVYPVLYRLDGDSVSFLHTISATAYIVDMRGQKSDYIVVAIQNTNRRRDMDPEGGADSFIRFIKGELVPFVEKSYRTNGSRILAGQSFSALFALYSFLKEPSLFDAYLLGSFALYKPELTPLFEDALKKSPEMAKIGRKSIFVANGMRDSYDPDGSKTKRGAQFLDSLSRSAPATLAIKTAVDEDEGHVPFGFVYDGLKWLDSRESTATK
jgi:predicted alpha/beta superfamily hydrolase